MLMLDNSFPNYLYAFYPNLSSGISTSVPVVPLGFNTSISTPFVIVSLITLVFMFCKELRTQSGTKSSETKLKLYDPRLIRVIKQNNLNRSRSVGSTTEVQSKQNHFKSIMDRCILNVRHCLSYKVSYRPSSNMIKYDGQFRLNMSKYNSTKWGSFGVQLDAELWLLYRSYNHQ